MMEEMCNIVGCKGEEGYGYLRIFMVFHTAWVYFLIPLSMMSIIDTKHSHICQMNYTLNIRTKYCI